MEVKSPKENKLTSIEYPQKEGEHLLKEAEYILSQQNRSDSARSSLLVGILLAVFTISIALGMFAEGNMYSHLAFGTAIIAGLSISRLLK